jgi:hypothetical protein
MFMQHEQDMKKNINTDMDTHRDTDLDIGINMDTTIFKRKLSISDIGLLRYRTKIAPDIVFKRPMSDIGAISFNVGADSW